MCRQHYKACQLVTFAYDCHKLYIHYVNYLENGKCYYWSATKYNRKSMNCALYQYHNHELILMTKWVILWNPLTYIIANQRGPCVLNHDLPAFVQRLPTYVCTYSSIAVPLLVCMTIADASPNALIFVHDPQMKIIDLRLCMMGCPKMMRIRVQKSSM